MTAIQEIELEGKPVYTIPSDETPTFFNRSALGGAVNGYLLSTIGMLLFSSAGISLPVIVGISALSGVVGGIAGKKDMIREQHEGKQISPHQSIINGGMVHGFNIGIATTVALDVISAFSGLPGINTAVSMMLVGGIAAMNGIVERDHEKALYEEVDYAMKKVQEKSISHSKTHTISPEEAQLLEARLRQSGQGNHSFAEALAAEQSTGVGQER